MKESLGRYGYINMNVMNSNTAQVNTVFRNRKDAGEKLALTLGKYQDENTLVLGIPRGGVETAYYVATHLGAELSIVIVRKLGYPFNPEAAMGAVAEDGSIYLSELAKKEISAEDIAGVLEVEKKEVERRIKILRCGKPLPEIKGRTVILVDDGIATGATLFAAIELCRNHLAGKIIVAAPIAGADMKKILSTKADAVIILTSPTDYVAVSQGYEDFYNLTDAEVLSFITRWEEEHSMRD